MFFDFSNHHQCSFHHTLAELIHESAMFTSSVLNPAFVLADGTFHLLHRQLALLSSCARVCRIVEYRWCSQTTQQSTISRRREQAADWRLDPSHAPTLQIGAACLPATWPADPWLVC